MYNFFFFSSWKPLTHVTKHFIELNIELRIEFRIQTEISQLFSYAVAATEDTAHSEQLNKIGFLKNFLFCFGFSHSESVRSAFDDLINFCFVCCLVFLNFYIFFFFGYYYYGRIDDKIWFWNKNYFCVVNKTENFLLLLLLLQFNWKSRVNMQNYVHKHLFGRSNSSVGNLIFYF